MKKILSYIFGLLLSFTTFCIIDTNVEASYMVSSVVEQVKPQPREAVNVHILSNSNHIEPHNSSTNCNNQLADILKRVDFEIPRNITIIVKQNKKNSHISDGIIMLECGEKMEYDLYHEIGHHVYHKLSDKGPFEHTTHSHNEFGKPNYITKYALTNQSEDFAETFAFYHLKKATLLKRAAISPTLRLKYEFIDSLY